MEPWRLGGQWKGRKTWPEVLGTKKFQNGLGVARWGGMKPR